MTDKKNKCKDLAAFRLARQDRELWELAAGRQGLNRSEFLRLALRDRIKRALFAESEDREGQ